MNIQKRQSIQKEIIDQSGQQRLILNDLILGSEGAQIVAELVPQYHASSLQHIEIKGNNIDAEGFEMIFTALMSCPHLKSIEAEWNAVGSGHLGLEALTHLVKNSRFLEFVDLKNNRISHSVATFIADLIKLNSKSLKVLDLRWNELGEIGAQMLYKSLAHNSGLKYLGLDDNRISLHTLTQIQMLVNNVARGTGPLNISQANNRMGVTNSHNNFQSSTFGAATYKDFPISQGSYASMDLQVHNAEMRSRLQNEQNQAEIYQSKIKLQIQKVLSKIKTTGMKHHEYQLRFDSLSSQSVNILNQLQQAERLFGIEKERFVGMEKRLNTEKSTLRTEKFNLNLKIQSLMEKNVMKYQREVEELEAIMNDKMDRLQGLYRERINRKRLNREKLTQLKQDITKLRLDKQLGWDKISETYGNTNQSVLQDRCIGLEDLVGKAQFDNKSQIKRGQYLSEQLSSLVLKGLQRQESMEKEIFQTQNQIKQKHNQMGTTNVEIEENQSKCALLESDIIDKESDIEMRRKYINYIQSQSNVNQEIERLKQQQDIKGQRLVAQTLDMRINDLEKAIRTEQTQNKMIRNQYDKLLGQVEGSAKRTIQAVLFEH